MADCSNGEKPEILSRNSKRVMCLDFPTHTINPSGKREVNDKGFGNFHEGFIAVYTCFGNRAVVVKTGIRNSSPAR